MVLTKIPGNIRVKMIGWGAELMSRSMLRWFDLRFITKTKKRFIELSYKLLR